MDVLNAHYDHVHELEKQTSASCTQINEALINLLQSRQGDHTHSGAMLSAATRATLGKRGIAQLEAVKGALEAATGSAALARRDAGELRDEVRSALATRDEALASAAEARNLQMEAVAQTEEATAAQVLTLTESTRRSERDMLAATKRAETAEARAEAAEAAVAEGERGRVRMAEALQAAQEASAAAAEQTARLEGQLRREREVLAKLMAENVLFVKRLQVMPPTHVACRLVAQVASTRRTPFPAVPCPSSIVHLPSPAVAIQLSEAERERAEREKRELMTQWRGQTEVRR